MLNVTQHPVETDQPAATALPLDSDRQRVVVERTEATIGDACIRYDLDLRTIPVRFDLKGRCAGMFRVKNSRPEIRYNPWIFARYYDDNLAETVPHEVAHYIVHRLHGRRHVRPHGREWREVMRALGAKPKATCSYDLSGLPQRRLKRFAYRCDCRTHDLTSIRHNRINAGRSRYHCQRCGGPLTQAD